MDDAIFDVMAKFSLEWHTLDLEKLVKIVAQEQRKEAKLCIMNLAERKCQEQEAAMK